MHTNVSRRQHEVPTRNESSFDVLAVLLIGGIGMFIALLGLYFDNTLFYIIGLIIAIASAGKAVVGFIAAIRNFIWENQDRKKNKDK